MRNKLSTFFILFTFLFVVIPSVAQSLKASLGLGISSYVGDLSGPGNVPNEWHAAISGGISYDLTERLRIRAEYFHGTIGADDKNGTDYHKLRNLNFKSVISEYALLCEFDLINPIEDLYNGYKTFVPYVFGGPGFFHFDPTTVVNGQTYHLHDYGTEGQYLNIPFRTYEAQGGQIYSLNQLCFQGGVGVKYNLNDNISIAIEFSDRITGTDYLDDVSRRSYIDPSLWTKSPKDQVAKMLSYRSRVAYSPNNGIVRGNPLDNDSYNSFMIKGIFNLDRYIFPSGHHSYKGAIFCPIRTI